MENKAFVKKMNKFSLLKSKADYFTSTAFEHFTVRLTGFEPMPPVSLNRYGVRYTPLEKGYIRKAGA